ncbi:MAG: aliphatic sulfonate ABC transporter substrate-binding protein [Arachnia sp.]
MDLNRRSLLTSLAVIPVLGTLASCGGTGGTGGETVSVNFGYIPDFEGTSLLAVANGQKLWDKHGLKAELKTFTNGPLQIQAMGTGDLDFGYIGPGAMWLPASGKARIVAINATGRADRVIAQAGITTIADLKGKKVAVPEGTSGDMILQLALAEAGMTLNDVEAVAMDPSTIVAAFSAKQVDAAGIWYPLIDSIKEQVPDLVELAKNTDFEDKMAFPSVFVSGADLPEKQPDKLGKVLKVIREAMDYRKEHMDETLKLVADMNDLEVESLRTAATYAQFYSSSELDTMTQDGTTTKWFTAMTDFFVGNGKIEGKPLPIDEFYLGDAFMKAGK